MIASLDVGLKRIGVALLIEGIVIPKEAIFRTNRDKAAAQVRAFLKEWGVKKLIVGLPVGGSSEEEMKRRIKHFVGLIAFEGEVEYIDESFSSFEAKEQSKGVFKDRRDGKIDSLSAKIILQRWLGE